MLLPCCLPAGALASHAPPPCLTWQVLEGEEAGGGKENLLRAFIGFQYSGPTRDMLLQAYEMRALVCCIDGVDEAAAMKNRIEDLVLKQLVPFGIRTVVSSRPEGVRLERYGAARVLNLSPLC